MSDILAPLDPGAAQCRIVAQTGWTMLLRLGLEDPPPPVHHDPRTTAYPHECSLLIRAFCAGCRQEYTLCHATESEVAEVMSQTWRCYPCSTVGVP